MNNEAGKLLAAAHWGYIKSLFLTHKLSARAIKVIGFHYVSAFIHGYKHGYEQALEDFKNGSGKK